MSDGSRKPPHTRSLAIVGWGKNPQGNQEAYLVLLPEPASATLLALAAPLIRASRRARR
ncbi:MAG: hypothetical protein U1A27_03380 [Phycisphaerae bacterium]